MTKLLLIVTLFLFACTHGKPSALIVVEKNKSGIDTIAAGDSKEITVSLKNTGSEKLIVENFNYSCECTTSDLKKGVVIPPASDLDIVFQITTTIKDAHKQKTLFCTIKSNAHPALTSIRVPVYVR
jgi:hypothetical protein